MTTEERRRVEAVTQMRMARTLLSDASAKLMAVSVYCYDYTLTGMVEELDDLQRRITAQTSYQL